MEEGSNAQPVPDTALPDDLPPAEIKSHLAEIAAAHSRADSLLAAIQQQADTAAANNNGIEKLSRLRRKSRHEIDEQSTAMKEAVASLQQQLDSANGLIAEIANLHGNAQATFHQTVEAKDQAAEALQSVQTLLLTATENANQVEAIRASAEQTQGAIATKSDHIEDGRLHSDGVLGEIDRLLTAAQQSTANAEAQHQASRTVMQNLNDLYESVQVVQADIASNAEVVSNLRKQCEEHTTAAKKLADIADETDRNVKAYELRLTELDQATADRLKTIEGLLPGAASAGLASAFNQRRVDFKWPQRIWQGIFVGSVLTLAGIAWLEIGLIFDPISILTWDRLGLSLLRRMPLAAPLIWLALHASGKAALAQRVEEDYAFKETVSRSFEGYRREMADLEGKALPESALSRFCTGVLGIITNPPGRIYEKHPLNETPLNAFADVSKKIADLTSSLSRSKGDP